MSEEINKMEIDENGVLVKYNGSDEKTVIPEGVLFIGDNAFAGCTALREVVMPETLAMICDEAFLNCSSLESIKLNDGLIVIGSRAFANTAVKHINIPDSVLILHKGAFENSKLEEIKLSDNLLFIEMNTFRMCSELKKVVLPKNLVGIGQEAFIGCSSLEPLEFPETTAYLHRSYFSGETILTSNSTTNHYDRDSSAGISTLADEIEKRYDKNKSYNSDKTKLKYHIGRYSFFGEKAEAKDIRGLIVNHEEDSVSYDFSQLCSDVVAFLGNDIKLCQNENGLSVIHLYEDIPTFDSGDREYNSYEEFYLIINENDLTGIAVRGGYYISSIRFYKNLTFADEKTKYFMNSLKVYDDIY